MLTRRWRQAACAGEENAGRRVLWRLPVSGFTLEGLLIQLFLRVPASTAGWAVPGALLMLPVIAAIGYGLMAFIPIFSMIRIVKIAENRSTIRS